MKMERVRMPSTAERDGGPRAGRSDAGGARLETRAFSFDGESPRQKPVHGSGGQRPRRRLLVVYAMGLLVLASVVVAAFQLHSQWGRTNGSLTTTRAELRRTIQQIATSRAALAKVGHQSTAAGQTLETETARLGADQQQLSAAEANIHNNGVSISDLDTCLSGVEKALNQISLGNTSGAAGTLNGVSASCRNARPSG